VILVDVNILIYASLPGFQQHQAARVWLDHQLSTTTPVGLPWVTVLAYLRLVTNPRIFAPPVAMAVAWQRVSAGLLVQPGVHGDLVPDAHLAALAIEHGLTLCSTDGDFARFPGLRWLNPLAK